MTWNVNQEKQDLKKKKVLHMIMKARDSWKTNSFMLASSLALYSISGSQYILDLLDSVGFGISYVCAKKYFQDFAAKNPPNAGTFQDGDVVFWADNVQTLSGSSRSSVVWTFSASLVTNHIIFFTSIAAQFDPSSDPMVWQHSGVADTSFDLSLDRSVIVNGHMSKTLDEKWKKEEEEEKVTELLKAKEEEEKQRKMKTCVCGLTYPKEKRKCDSLSCGLSLPNAPNT